MYESFNNATLFLITTIFNLYLTVLVVRLILAWARADYFNPITRFIVQITNPVIKPLRKAIPTYAGIEYSTLLFIILLEIIKNYLVGLFWMGVPAMSVLLIFSIRNTITLILSTFFYSILINAILSWINPGYSPLGQVLGQLSEPILRPLRRFIPPIAGFDITPIPALLILQFLIMAI
jgi:YggT family protein